MHMDICFSVFLCDGEVIWCPGLMINGTELCLLEQEKLNTLIVVSQTFKNSILSWVSAFIT